MSKFCKDCAHFRPPLHQWLALTVGTALCARPTGTSLSPLYGERQTRSGRTALAERRRSWFSDRCGPKAKYFTARQAEQSKVIQLVTGFTGQHLENKDG